MANYRILNKITFTGILSTFFLLFLTVASYAEIGIETSIQPSRIRLGDTARLTIIVSGAGDSVRPPQLPKLANFTTYSQGHSQEITFINGRMSSRSVFSFALIPNLAGKHVLGQIDIPIGNKVYKTGVLELEVTQNGSPAPSIPIRSPKIFSPAKKRAKEIIEPFNIQKTLFNINDFCGVTKRPGSVLI